MKLSEIWLREWVNPSISGRQLVEQLTMAGLEVDAYTPAAGQFSHVIVAEVRHTRPHPQADKLTICDVSTGSTDTIQVICGAANVRTGLKVALAQVGAHLPGDINIKKAKLRGELSQGMLCSGAELGLEERSEGILELPVNAPIGEDLHEFMQLDDHILDVDLTPNRADCFSVYGIGREVAALNRLPFAPFKVKASQTDISDTVPINIEAPQACPHYCARIIRGIDSSAVTPLWLKERLRRSGIRSLHPVVDVTNYVMLSLGQPMHAFDLAKINGEIRVRYASAGEKLTLLDKQTVHLSSRVLTIADKHKPLAVAGIMGGEASAVDAETTDIILESAYFNPVPIADTVREYGLITDSSQRFERGVDPSLQITAIEYASQLLLEIAGGHIGPVNSYKSETHFPKDRQITFRPDIVKQLCGIDIPHEDMKCMLEHLGIQVETTPHIWCIHVPPHRFDIRIEVDIVEEVLRLHGYDCLPGTSIQTTLKPGTLSPATQYTQQIATILAARGYQETISYSFVDSSLQQIIYPDLPSKPLVNPISQELSHMRVGLWPGLLASMLHNVHRQQTAMKLFECGVIFDASGETVQEKMAIAGLVMGDHGVLNWSEDKRAFDFYDMKGDLEALCKQLLLENVTFTAHTHPALHPGKTAAVKLGDVQIGVIGVLHPQIANELDCAKEVILFELYLSNCFTPCLPKYQPISKYPHIRRDLSLLMNSDIPIARIKQAIEAVVPTSLLKRFDIFDVYTGGNIPADKKSVAIALTLQDEKRTLVDEEVQQIISAIINTLQDTFAITLRD